MQLFTTTFYRVAALFGIIFVVVACTSSQPVMANGDVIGSPKVDVIVPQDVPHCVTGSVLVGFDVDDNGQVIGASIIESTPNDIFDSAALDTVRKMHLPRASGKKGLKYRVKYPPRGDCE